MTYESITPLVQDLLMLVLFSFVVDCFFVVCGLWYVVVFILSERG